jgi:hypothetical protein
VGDGGAEHQYGETGGGERDQDRGDVEHARQDQAESAEHLGGADQPDGPGGEVLGPLHVRVGEELAPLLGQLRQAGGQEHRGEQAGDDPQKDIHGPLSVMG